MRSEMEKEEEKNVTKGKIQKGNGAKGNKIIKKGNKKE